METPVSVFVMAGTSVDSPPLWLFCPVKLSVLITKTPRLEVQAGRIEGIPDGDQNSKQVTSDLSVR